MDFFKNLFQRVKENNVDEKGKEEGKGVKIHYFKNQQTSQYNECVICLEDMKTNEDLAILYCSHIYHSKCINTWAEKKKICPLCDYSFE